MRQMKRRLIMLLLVLALMIMHITAVVPAEEPPVKAAAEETKSEEKKSEEKKAEEVKEEANSQTTADEIKTDEKKADKEREEAKDQVSAEETKPEDKKAEEKKEEAAEAEGESQAEETKTEEEKSEEKKAQEGKEEAAAVETPVEETEPEEKKAEESEEEAAEDQTPAEETRPEEEKTEDKKSEEAGEEAAESQTVTTPAVNAAKDVWIDNTEDTSVTNVYGVIKEHDESGQGGGDTFYFKGQFNVTYSNPRPQAVQDAINETKEQLENTAKERGYKLYTISEVETEEEVWDHRKYETIEDGDAVLIGDTEYYGGTPEGDITRTHVASGDYGRKTTYQVVLDVTLNHAYSIAVNTTGKGTVTVEPESATEGTSVSVNYKADKGYRLADALVRNDSVEGPDGQISAVVYGESGMTEDSISFKMPASDVTVYVGFVEIPHDHELVKTEEVKASCEKDGTEAYWTCSICGRLFSDEKGSKEIEKPVKISASGHSWGEWVVTKEPTEEETGEKTRTCKIDPNHKETVSIPALEKEEQEPAVEEEKDDKDNKDKEVTAPKDNKKNDSGSSKKTSSNHSKKSSKKSSSKAKSPKTGDRTAAFFWAFMAMASFAGMMSAVLAVGNKKRRS